MKTSQRRYAGVATGLRDCGNDQVLRTYFEDGVMGTFLWIGSAFGAAVGLLHGVYLYRQQVARASANDPIGRRAAAAYYGLWAILLWTIFGAYVLAFWILGAVAWPVARLILRVVRPVRRA